MSKRLDTAFGLGIALQSAQDGLPTHIHLLPKGRIETTDTRGPYFAENLDEIVSASMMDLKDGRLVVDLNHSTDLSAPKGGEAPAVGWITALQAREDGIWGEVEWTAYGSELVKGKAYRFVSPVVGHGRTDKKVSRILRASLVNNPNFRDMVALHQEESAMALKDMLAELLGLPATASDEDVTAKVKDLLGKKPDEALPALQSAMSEISVALGVAQGAEVASIIAAAKAAKASTALPAEITALQAEVSTLTTDLNAERDARKRERAEAYVDEEIKRGRAGLKPSRDRFISMHMADQAGAEAIIGAMPVLNGETVLQAAQTAEDGVSLNAAQIEVADQLGISHADFHAALAAETKKG